MLVNHWAKWAPHEDEWLEQMMGRSVDSIVKRCQRLGLTKEAPLPRGDARLRAVGLNRRNSK